MTIAPTIGIRIGGYNKKTTRLLASSIQIAKKRKLILLYNMIILNNRIKFFLIFYQKGKPLIITEWNHLRVCVCGNIGWELSKINTNLNEKLNYRERL